MLQNQPITTPLFQTSLRSWRAKYVAEQQQAQQAETEPTPSATEQPAQVGPQRVKRLAPRRRKRRQGAGV